MGDVIQHAAAIVIATIFVFGVVIFGAWLISKLPWFSDIVDDDSDDEYRGGFE